MTEEATRVFVKIPVPESRQNPEKIPVKEFTFTKVAGLRPATRLKMNSATGIFLRILLKSKVTSL